MTVHPVLAKMVDYVWTKLAPSSAIVLKVTAAMTAALVRYVVKQLIFRNVVLKKY